MLWVVLLAAGLIPLLFSAGFIFGAGLASADRDYYDELREAWEENNDYARALGLPVYDREALETALWERAAQDDEVALEVLRWRMRRQADRMLGLY